MKTAGRQAGTLRKERDVLRALLADTQAQLAYFDTRFNFVAVNPAYANGSGYAQEKLIGRNHFELFPNAENQAIFERVLATGEPVAFRAKPFTFPQRPELGVTYWDWTLTADKDEQGQVRGLVLSLMDVTERERARRRGMAHLAQTETLITVLQQILSATTLEGVQQAVVRAARELTRARIAISGHNYHDGEFRIGATSHAPGTPECPAGQVFAMQRGGVYMEVLQKKAALRLTQEQLLAHPSWWGLPEGHAPLGGLLGVPLMGRDGQAIGLIMVTDKEEGDFTGDDEAVLTQLAALSSLGLQHLEARDEARRRAAELKATADATPNGIVIFDMQANIVQANSVAAIILGYSAEQMAQPLRSRAARVNVTGQDGEPVAVEQLPVSRALRGETVRDLVLSIQHDALPSPTWVHVSAALIRSEDGKPLGVVQTLSDLTPLRDAQRRLESANEKLLRQSQELLRNYEDLRRLTDALQAERSRMSRYAQRLETLHRADQAILAGHTAEEVAKATLPYIRELVPCERVGISLFDLAAGRVSLLAVAVSGETQMPTGWTGPLSDSAWPADLAQGKIRTVEDLSSLTPLSPFEATLLAEGIRSWTNVPLIVQGNLLGALNLGTNAPGLLTDEQIEVMREMADELAVGLQQARLRDEVEHYAQKLEGRVAERTAELQASQARLQTIFDHAPTGLALLGRRGQVVESNAALETLLGYSAAELRDMALVQWIHPDDVDDQLANPVQWAESGGGVYRRALRMLRKDGELLRVNLSVAALGPAVEGGDRGIAIIEDVTEATQAQEKLVQSEKLAIAGRLAASLAHEINNPLQSVIGCLSLIEEAGAEGADTSRYVQVTRQELRRAVGIIRRLRDVYAPSKLENKQLTDVNALVEAVLTLTQKRCEDSDVEVAWTPGKDLPQLNLVAGSMQQVFLNLVLNAVEAMPQGGRLQVSSARTKRPPGVRVTITDSGGGIPAETLAHLFEPFRTSKADGLGLGLYVTHKIVDEHGGQISVESRSGVGSTFQVWLPE